MSIWNIIGLSKEPLALILGLFVLIWMHFQPESKYGNDNIKFEE